MPKTPSTNQFPVVPPLPVAPVEPDQPTNGSLAYRKGRFYQVHAPQPPLTNFRFVEILLGRPTRPPRVLSIDPASLSAAITRREVTVLPKVASAPADLPARPYPFEAGGEAAKARRARLWTRRDVVDLRRRGLLMTGEEYIRLLAARARSAPLPVEGRDA